MGSNPTLSALFCGFPDKDDAAPDAPFASRSTQSDGAHVGTKREWMRCPTDFGLLRFDKDLFAAYLARTGATTGTPPKLPKWCVEESEKAFARSLKLGLDKWTYFARAKHTGRIKIGVSKDPTRRVSALAHARYGEEAELLDRLPRLQLCKLVRDGGIVCRGDAIHRSDGGNVRIDRCQQGNRVRERVELQLRIVGGFGGRKDALVPPDTTACIFWLKNRRPDEWRDKQEGETPAGMIDALAKLIEGLPQ